MMNTKTYSEMILLPTFEERYEYLKLNGKVGDDTFGFDRYLNQLFYKSDEWKSVRNAVIVRDNGCDLGIEGRDIQKRVIIHHMNPLTKKDILSMSNEVMNPEFLICVSHETHNAIHYGDEELLVKDPIVRRANDTCPWR